MSWQRLTDLLQRIFNGINTANSVESPDELWRKHQDEIATLARDGVVANQIINLSQDLLSPKAVELARLFSLLKRRMSVRGASNALVSRIRAEVVLRQRPPYNVRVSTLRGETQQIARMGRRTVYSRFQIIGWERVLDAIRNQAGLVIVAPTGSGKTETFMLPILHEIATAVARRASDDDIPRFVFLYPRVPLLKDQLARIFRYAYWAEQNYLSAQTSMFRRTNSVNRGITIGFQFAGIKSNTQETRAIAFELSVGRNVR